MIPSTLCVTSSALSGAVVRTSHEADRSESNATRVTGTREIHRPSPALAKLADSRRTQPESGGYEVSPGRKPRERSRRSQSSNSHRGRISGPQRTSRKSGAMNLTRGGSPEESLADPFSNSHYGRISRPQRTQPQSGGHEFSPGRKPRVEWRDFQSRGAATLRTPGRKPRERRGM